MKAQFKNITLLAHHRDREAVTDTLLDLGVLHLNVDPEFRNENIEALERRKNQVNKCVDSIREQIQTKELETTTDLQTDQSIDEIVPVVLELRRKLDSVVQTRETLRKEHLKLQPWGNFDWSSILRLEKYGIEIQFYQARKKEFKKYDFSEYIIEVIHEGPDSIYFILVSKGQETALPFEQVRLPKINLSEVNRRLTELSNDQQDIKTELLSWRNYLPVLEDELKRIEDELSICSVNGSFTSFANDHLIAMSGWYPIGMEDRLTYVLQKEELPYTLREPQKDEKVPVLLKNPKYPRLFESITEIFELPNYREMDLTPFIAVFYPILFAYCLGDAGYGAILLVASIAGIFTFLKDKKNFALLGIVLGLMTTVMGIVKSGSIFGLPLQGTNHPLFEFLATYILIPDDNTFIFSAFNVALMIGVVQILLGIIVSIINKIRNEGWVPALSQVGKLLIVTNLIWIFLADMQGMSVLEPFQPVRQVGFYSGIAMVLLFHDLNLGLIKRMASGVLPLFFIFTGILGDILSYVRLFALGVSSSVLGLVVNQIGMQIMGDSWWGIPIAVIFLIFGHSLNFGIAVLGSFVHPLRLTFVEFYNNAQFEGGGIAYKPFRKNYQKSLET
jgi:V/A-type H+-transporting ATPase subunit I